MFKQLRGFYLRTFLVAFAFEKILLYNDWRIHMRNIIGNNELNGNCYVEDVLDSNGLKQAKILFDNNCNLIDDANDYLKELRITSLISYNSISVVARELCYFYNYLNISNINISDINIGSLIDFIGYLKNVEKKKSKYAIENSISNERNTNIENNNIINLFDNKKLSDFTIARIVNRAFLYLVYLYEEEKLRNIKIFNKINTKDKRKRILKRYCLSINSYKKDKFDGINSKLITKDQIQLVKEALYLSTEICTIL